MARAVNHFSTLARPAGKRATGRKAREAAPSLRASPPSACCCQWPLALALCALLFICAALTQRSAPPPAPPGSPSGSLPPATATGSAPAPALPPQPLPLPQQPQRRLAIATRGGADGLAPWAEWVAALPPEVRAEVALFYSAHAGDLGAPVAAAAALSLGPALASFRMDTGVTWTGGRNLLMQAIYAAEVQRGAAFDYWVFTDGDALRNMQCRGCAEEPALASAACCGAFLLRDVLLRYSFATVATQLLPHEWQWGEGSSEGSSAEAFVFRDCADSIVMAFHRQAVPVALPYLEEMDAESWWGGQAMLFHFTRGCLGGANALPARHLHPSASTVEHGSYPKGRDQAKEVAVAAAAFPLLTPEIISPAVFQDNACENPPPPLLLGSGVRLVAGGGAGAHAGWVGEWNSTPHFAQCLAVRGEDFVRVVGRGVPQAPMQPR